MMMMTAMMIRMVRDLEYDDDDNDVQVTVS